MKLLVADDHPHFLDSLVALLEAHGMDVLAAIDGASALELTAVERPELALIDSDLRTQDGHRLVSVMASRSPDLKIVALCKVDEERLCRAALQAGAHHCFTKSQDAKDLLQLLAELTQGTEAGHSVEH